MTENAAAMPETVAYMADAGVPTVNVIQMIDVNGRSGYLDPTLHFSADYLEWIKQRCIAVAKEKRIRLGWDLSGLEWFDFRDPRPKIRPRRSKVANDYWDQRMKLVIRASASTRTTGCCIERDGWLAPCGLATEGELRLGNLREQDFDEIWNGPTARTSGAPTTRGTTRACARPAATWTAPRLAATCRSSRRCSPSWGACARRRSRSIPSGPSTWPRDPSTHVRDQKAGDRGRRVSPRPGAWRRRRRGGRA